MYIYIGSKVNFNHFENNFATRYNDINYYINIFIFIYISKYTIVSCYVFINNNPVCLRIFKTMQITYCIWIQYKFKKSYIDNRSSLCRVNFLLFPRFYIIHLNVYFADVLSKITLYNIGIYRHMVYQCIGAIITIAILCI